MSQILRRSSWLRGRGTAKGRHPLGSGSQAGRAGKAGRLRMSVLPQAISLPCWGSVSSSVKRSQAQGYWGFTGDSEHSARPQWRLHNVCPLLFKKQQKTHLLSAGRSPSAIRLAPEKKNVSVHSKPSFSKINILGRLLSWGGRPCPGLM